MIPNSLSTLWTAGARELCNHLWQSTLFASVVALLALALRKYPARARYWLWMAASVKFLIPFSLLIAIGSHLAPPSHPTSSQTNTYIAIDEMSQPFTTAPSLAVPILIAAPPRDTLPTLPVFLTIAWLCGFLAVLASWAVQWRRVARSMREAAPLREGRVLEILRRIEQLARVSRPIPIFSSPNSMEPGIFGILRPVLLWPEFISRHLDDAHLESVLAHEACHVRRRDNLTSVLHMLVEALFWFHPLVWWMESKLVKERERACDEEVLLLCNQPKVYAESILKVCELCVESHLTCVSGITGADLKQRIRSIMTLHLCRLTLLRKLLLASLALSAIAAPLAFGVIYTPAGIQTAAQSSGGDWMKAAGANMSFDVATVKPSKPGVEGEGSVNFVLGPGNVYASTGGRFSATNLSLLTYIEFAYKLTDAETALLKTQVPKWVAVDRFDVQAKSEDHNPTKDQMRLMVQSLLVDRFKLAVRHETREIPVYALVLARPGKTGSQLHPHPANDISCSNIFTPRPDAGPASAPSQPTVVGGYPTICGGITDAGVPSAPSHLRLGARNVTMALLAAHLSGMGDLGRPVIDQTGLSGTYDFVLEWGPESRADATPAALQPDDSGPPLLDALTQQLGFKLKSTTGPVEVLVVEHIEKPSLDGAEMSSPAPASSVPVVLAQSAPANPASNIAATWQGTLHSGRDFRFVVKIMKADDGTLRATFYNLDGPPGGIPSISTTLTGSLLKLDLAFATYEGTVSVDGNLITGTWRQGPSPQPLNFARTTPATEWTIPEPPPRMAPMAADANPAFEVATIKPSRPDEHGPRFDFQQRRFSVIHTSVSNLIKFSYGLQQSQLASVPDWVNSENYDISAVPGGEGEPSIKQWRSMVKKLMADRFQLKFHYEKREQTVYVLTVAKTGPKLARSQSDPSATPGLGFGPGNFGATNASMADIAEALGQGTLDRPVLDQTGLAGRFNLRLRWTPDGPPPATENADAPPDIFTAIQEELGLKLVSTKAPVDVLLIDHIERPSKN